MVTPGNAQTEHPLGHATAVRALQSAAAKKRRYRWRHNVIVFTLLALAMGFGALLATWTEPVSLGLSARRASVTSEAHRTGSITVGSGDRCRQTVFDNDTGHTIEARGPCAKPRLDNNGLPIPAGTAQRLDAISKSFQKP